MTNFLSAVPALIGVLVGVIAAGWNDRIRWRRSQEIRWDERRIEAYMEYARTIKKIHLTALAMVDPSSAHNVTEPIDHETGIEMIAQAEAERATAWEPMLLLADQPTADAALRWRSKVKIETDFVRSRPNDVGSDGWVAIVRNVDDARDRYYEVARRSIRVVGGTVISTLTQLMARDGAMQDSADRTASGARPN